MAYDKLLIVDLETTGLDPKYNEIIEIGAALVDMKTLDLIWEHEQKVKPLFIERAHPEALEVNGYNEADWKDAPLPGKAIPEFVARLDHTMIHTGQNVWFDMGFYLESLSVYGLIDPLDPTPHGYSYHRLDVTSMAYPFQEDPVFRMSKLAPTFGVEPEPAVHRAINGVRVQLDILRKLKHLGAMGRWAETAIRGPLAA